MNTAIEFNCVHCSSVSTLSNYNIVQHLFRNFTRFVKDDNLPDFKHIGRFYYSIKDNLIVTDHFQDLVNLVNASVSLKNKTKFEDILLMIGTNDPDFLRKMDFVDIDSVPEIGIGFGYSDPTMKLATCNLPSTWASYRRRSGFAW